jgi:hypothetical protein
MGNGRIWLNILLLAVVAALAALAYLRPGASPGEADRRPLVRPKTTGVDEIRIRPRAGEAIRLRRREGSWRLVEPRAAPADPARARAVAGLLSAVSRGRVRAADGAGDRFGLAEPDVLVTLAGHTFALGDDHPIKRQRYVRVDGGVHLVATRALRRISGKWTDYVSRRLLPAGAEVTRMELPGLTARKGDDGWRAREDGPEPEALARLADAWQHRRAMALEAAEPGDGGPWVRLHIAGRQEPVAYRIRSRDEQLRLYRPGLGLVYRLGGDAAADLLQPE